MKLKTIFLHNRNIIYSNHVFNIVALIILNFYVENDDSLLQYKKLVFGIRQWTSLSLITIISLAFCVNLPTYRKNFNFSLEQKFNFSTDEIWMATGYVFKKSFNKVFDNSLLHIPFPSE